MKTQKVVRPQLYILGRTKSGNCGKATQIHEKLQEDKGYFLTRSICTDLSWLHLPISRGKIILSLLLWGKHFSHESFISCFLEEKEKSECLPLSISSDFNSEQSLVILIWTIYFNILLLCAALLKCRLSIILFLQYLLEIYF